MPCAKKLLKYTCLVTGTALEFTVFLYYVYLIGFKIKAKRILRLEFTRNPDHIHDLTGQRR